MELDDQCNFDLHIHRSCLHLNQINGLVRDKKLQDPDYKEVKLIEIAPKTPAGFFNYFIERKDIYRRAYELAVEKFLDPGR